MSTDKVSMSEIEPSIRLGGEIRAMLTPRSSPALSGFSGTMRLRPGQFVSEHYHPFSDEFLFVAAGDVTAWLDGEPQALARNDALAVRRGRRHRLVNDGDGDALLVFTIAPLAPTPETGHVETESPPDPGAAPPRVGG